MPQRPALRATELELSSPDGAVLHAVREALWSRRARLSQSAPSAAPETLVGPLGDSLSQLDAARLLDFLAHQQHGATHRNRHVASRRGRSRVASQQPTLMDTGY